jgi:hypothetical protein
MKVGHYFNTGQLAEHNTPREWPEDFRPGGVTYVAPIPKVLAMTTYQGQVIIAREDGVFRLEGDKLVKIEVVQG